MAWLWFAHLRYSDPCVGFLEEKRALIKRRFVKYDAHIETVNVRRTGKCWLCMVKLGPVSGQMDVRWGHGIVFVLLLPL